jgi:hypothetical protein
LNVDPRQEVGAALNHNCHRWWHFPAEGTDTLPGPVTTRLFDSAPAVPLFWDQHGDSVWSHEHFASDALLKARIGSCARLYLAIGPGLEFDARWLTRIST